MKRFRILSLLPLAVTLLSLAGCKSEKQEPLKTIVILYENDVHCAIDGYAVMAGYRNAIADTAWVGLVSAGDYLQGGPAGALSHGGYIIDIMNEMGYDAVGLGNHEFDFSGPRLFELIEKLKAPVVCCNLFDAMTEEQIFPSYSIRYYGPKKVAFVGVLTPETVDAESYAFYDEDNILLYDLHPEDVYERVQKAAQEARDAGADYVIVLSHMGEENVKCEIGSKDLVASTRGIDAVIDGHSHETIACDMLPNLDGTLIPVTQTGTGFANIGKLVITTDGKISTELVPLEEITSFDATVAGKVAEIEQEMDIITSQKLADSDVVLRINSPEGERLVRKAETTAGDFICDAMRYVLDTDMAFSNGGGVREDIPAGEVTYGDLITTFPFDNYLVKLEVIGGRLIELIEQNTKLVPKEDGNFPQCSGLRCVVSLPDHKVVSFEVEDRDGKYVPLDPQKYYTVATVNYCFTNGAFNNVLQDCTVLERTTMLYREAAAEYITNALGGHIGAEYAEPKGCLTFVNR